MLTSQVTIHPAFTIAPVPHRLFGAFVEHMGRCVYGGIYEPTHPESDVDGIRLDVLKLTRELGVSVVRYPGGNFVSGYQWEDGVGPADQRPARLDLAWRSRETNQFGLNEFMGWSRLAGAEPMLAVNLGTRGITEACNLVEYANHPGGTYYSDLRAAHGVAAPHDVKLWCLGNEMDGPWQLGHKTADEYGRLAVETARAMRQVDPTIELVACGSSNERMPTFGSWEATVLDHTYDDVDYLSLHAYFMQGEQDVGTFLASAMSMDAFIDGVVATADHIRAKKRSSKQLKLSFDEWNLWDETRFAGHTNLEWATAPRLIEETYNVLDAVVFASLLMSLLRHADRVEIACLAQLVNVIAPIRSEPGSNAWRQTIFYPFAMTARHARGEVLHIQQTAPRYATAHGDATVTDVIATREPDSGDVAIFAVNRDQQESALLDIDIRAFADMSIVEHVYLGGDGLNETNSEEFPEHVNLRRGRGAQVSDHHLSISLPPVSWTMLRLSPATQ
ncbi:MAG: alpha-L-arabinofuranosidase [Actinomycetota bacterium]|nr:alpha-L-arabinofuranosidase [Actinomycetota bacterium]